MTETIIYERDGAMMIVFGLLMAPPIFYGLWRGAGKPLAVGRRSGRGNLQPGASIMRRRAQFHLDRGHDCAADDSRLHDVSYQPEVVTPLQRTLPFAAAYAFYVIVVATAGVFAII